MAQLKNPVFVLVLAMFFALPGSVPEAGAQTTPAAPASPADPLVFAPLAADGLDLNEFVWKNRLVVVFANSAQDPAFIEQLRLLQDRWPELLARDVVVITDTDPGAMTDVRRSLRPRGFSLVIIEKDGRVELRKPLPWDGREITRAIDKMPIRREEIRNAPSGLPAPPAQVGG